MKTNQLPPQLRFSTLNLFKLFVATLATLFALLTASAQGEWKWAHYWTGNDDPLNSYNAYNYVTRTAFDNDGNVYVFGSFGGNASLHTENGTAHFFDNSTFVTNNSPGTFLAKFDSIGDMVWVKVIKSLNNSCCMPYDMLLRDDKITIAGEYGFQLNDVTQFWFLDTLIDAQCALSYPSGTVHPPYTFGYFSYFATFDLDGNKLENHFVHTLSRERPGGFSQNKPLSNRIVGSHPICVDSHGNTFIAMSTYYGGSDTLPYTIVVDGDSAKTYQILLPGNCYNDNQLIYNLMICKFTPTWELDWMKLMVDHTEGLSPYIPYDTVHPYFMPYMGGMSIDEQDNLYISGYLWQMDLMHEHNQYPIHIYWDNSHYSSVLGKGMAYYFPFIVKYSPDGNVSWANQAYMHELQAGTWQCQVDWTDNVVADNRVYLMGRTVYNDNYPSIYYFDNENNNMPVTQSASYFVCFNKQNGFFESYGIVPGEKSDYGLGKTLRPAVSNNHFIGLAKDYYSRYYLLCYFNTNGQFMGADTITHEYNTFNANQNVTTDNKGHLLCDFVNNQNLTFGHDFTLNFTDYNSHAVIAYRSDPSILEPYPVDSTAVPQYDERLSEIRLYPNPATDRVVIESPEGLPVGMVAVTNESGQLLFLQPATSCRTELSVRNLPAGLYVAHVSTSVGSTAIKFVVRN